MRVKKVFENIGFKRGLDSKEALGVVMEKKAKDIYNKTSRPEEVAPYSRDPSRKNRIKF
jgi:hypothetical protein